RPPGAPAPFRGPDRDHFVTSRARRKALCEHPIGMRILTIALALALSPVACAARAETPAPPFVRTLVGRVGGRAARLVLTHSDGHLDGRLAFTPRFPTVQGRPT